MYQLEGGRALQRDYTDANPRKQNAVLISYNIIILPSSASNLQFTDVHTSPSDPLHIFQQSLVHGSIFARVSGVFSCRGSANRQSHRTPVRITFTMTLPWAPHNAVMAVSKRFCVSRG